MMLAALVALCCAPAQLHAKPIRLRSQIIPDKASVRATLRGSAADSPSSGLFLIQLAETPPPTWREALRALGVEVLRYVPDDSFVAKFNGIRSSQVEALPFVRWVGEYRAEYKLHRDLQQAAKAGVKAAEPIQISVLLSPRATPTDTAQVRGQMHSVRQESRLRVGTVIRGKIPAGRLDALARSDAVLWIEPARDMKLFDEVSSKIVAGDGGPNRLLTQSLGYDGGGVKVAVADSGLNNGDAATMHPDLFGRTPAFFHYGSLTDAADEHSHGTHVAGIVAGNGATGETDENGALYGLGVAPAASIIAQRIFDGVGNYEPPPSFGVLTSNAVTTADADIGSNSWGDDTQGRYDTSAMEFDELVRDADPWTPGDQPYILEFSAGNAGPGSQTIGSPAVAKNVIATGAVENDRLDFLIYADGPDAMADFSSRGPCEDGRIKPDLVAPGTWIASLQSESASDLYAWLPISANYQYQGGTSQAGPHASGAAAVFVQYYRATHTNATPSPALVKAALINSAVDMDDEFGTAPVPNNDEGWGRLDLTELIGSPRVYEFLDQTVLLATGQQYEQRILVDRPDEPLKITLAYTDVPGFPGAIPALVNDLDLEVIGPDGRVYRGNQFENGESVPDAPAADNLNNVEGVHLLAPLPGEYLVRVRARNVVEDARTDTGAIDQDFALVMSAGIAPPGTGIVTFDRLAYRAPDTMKLTLVDYDLAGQPTATISLRSSTETNAESVVVRASGTSGLFTGNVATATGPALPDGILQVGHGDLIQAVYQDAHPPATNIFTVRADLLPPIITNVFVTNRFGHAEVRWNTDEPAASIVRYGTNTLLRLAVTNTGFASSHIVPLTGLAPGTTNYLKVICADVAGNSSTNDNGGALFQFVAPRTPAILLVDAFFDDVVFEPPPPPENYTRPLDQLGLAYDVWNIATEPSSITVTDLQPYRVVIWRLPEASLSRPTFTASERAALTQYLNGSGALFVASMEATTRLDESGASAFRQNILHVAQYTEDVTVPDADGVDGDPIGDGLSLTMDYATDYFDFDLSDTITPGTNAVGFLVKSGTGAYVGLRYPRVGVDSPGRIVFLSFPFDALPENDPPNDRAGLLRRILVFLAPGLNGEGNVAFDRSAYTIPSQLTVEVADADLEGQSQIAVTFYSTTQPAGLPLTLPATPRPGVFRGTVSLVATNSGGGDPELRVHSGDTVWADYFDASLNAIASAQATIETNPPAISNVSAEPGYVDALVTWDTSELTDATVQFGESPLLGRSTSTDDLANYHEITLYELQPDRAYYIRVISRDRAGNVTVDDNNRQLYTFTTLTPLNPPWFDDTEHSETNWAVYTPEESEGGWELGAPNTLFAEAHSPTNCWATNLRFNFVSEIESYLISPAILLTGGNHATLRFWQSYDFSYLSDSDILHGGEVLLIPNNALAPITLAEYDGDVADWHEVQFDLTPYMGQIIYVAWHYFLFSFDAWPRQGWLVDDLAITVTNVPPGTVIITNNLWQAFYALTGPTNLSEGGLGRVLTNAPPGNYVIRYASVPYYQAPPIQSNSLASGGTVILQGNYTFTDANSNGIPDSWELEKFGAVDPLRTRITDTDHDGMSDWAEFIAGTDPNNPPPPFRLTATLMANGSVRLDWASAPGLSYRMHTSTNGTTWTPHSEWMVATGPSTNFTVATLANESANLFRVEAALGANPSGAAPAFRVTAQVLTNHAVQLDWPSASGRGYLVHGSTDGLTWTPCSDWIQASGPATFFTLPPFTNGAPYLFRVEVQP